MLLRRTSSLAYCVANFGQSIQTSQYIFDAVFAFVAQHVSITAHRANVTQADSESIGNRVSQILGR